ncbi:hypothetical protein C0V70_09925 [Bacteriovorax stolpii]|uniref:SGNH hydrolase-type esterase domain-containing protein n=1 Tax=Bacteriovorax stolpii TaxID=960 RepID=A0A2K9NSB2_BACTC|nr:SGNH/GDSL hydrolase family protein [Bacteriovorax stolpii]AUN98416.1 hypothetical protein C0V70_09925 [Bacteriovorax stolpii]
MHDSNQKIERFLARTFMVLISSVLCLTSAEIIYRTFVREKVLKDAWMLTDDNHVPRPYVMATGRPGSPIYNDFHNELGYRGHLPVLPKPSDEFRVIVLGGSTVHFNKVDIPRYIEAAAHKEAIGKNLKAYNFGIASSVSQQDLVRLVTDVIEYDPDLVIHYGGGNDVFAVVDPRVNYPHRFSLYEKKVWEGQSVREYPFFHSILLGSQIYRDLFTEDIKKRDFADSGFATPAANQTEELRLWAYTQNMEIMNHISQSFGINFLSVIQPMVYFKKNAGSEVEKSFLQNTEQVNTQEERRRNILFTFSHKKFPYADCTGIYDESKEEVFRDYIHLVDGKDSLPGECIWKAIKEKNLMAKVRKERPLNLQPSHLFFTGNQGQ